MWKIVLNKGQKLFFTSDTHYNHKNICRGVSEWTGGVDKTRDFKNLDQMNATIVNNINETVGQDDILVHIGDWSFGGFESIIEFRKRIVCKNIYLIFGNHDHHIERNKDGVQGYFINTSHYQVLNITEANGSKHSFVLSHYPICSWHDMNQGRIHLFGHVHLPANQKVMRGRSMDIGMDGNDLRPYELREIISLLKDRPIKTNVVFFDHHETETR